MTEECPHPAFFNTMCVSCGKRILPSDQPQQGKVSSLTLNGGNVLQLSSEEAIVVQKNKLNLLNSRQKLALVLDLDHTLVHTIQVDGAMPANPVQLDGEIHHLSIEETNRDGNVCHLVMKKRPHLDKFLAQAHEHFQMSIYTAGTRRYAEAVAKVIDPTRKYISDRIVSRSDGPVKPHMLQKNLNRIFLQDSSMAVIMDDREDVWIGPQSEQLLLVRPYLYFYPGNAASQLVGSTSETIAEVNNGPGCTSVGGNGGKQTIMPALSLVETPDKPAGTIIRHAPSFSAEYTESDDQLLRCLDVLKKLHTDYYKMKSLEANSPHPSVPASLIGSNPSSTPTTPSKPEVGVVLRNHKTAILRGYSLTFSALISRSSPPENNFLWRLAVSLGARVTRELTPETTHVIAVQTGTQKVREALSTRSSNVWVVHPDWLMYCRWAVARADEKTFLLAPPSAGQPYPSPMRLDEAEIQALEASDALKTRERRICTTTDAVTMSNTLANMNAAAAWAAVKSPDNAVLVGEESATKKRRVMFSDVPDAKHEYQVGSAASYSKAELKEANELVEEATLAAVSSSVQPTSAQVLSPLLDYILDDDDSDEDGFGERGVDSYASEDEDYGLGGGDDVDEYGYGGAGLDDGDEEGDGDCKFYFERRLIAADGDTDDFATLDGRADEVDSEDEDSRVELRELKSGSSRSLIASSNDEGGWRPTSSAPDSGSDSEDAQAFARARERHAALTVDDELDDEDWVNADV